ncbi:hypothetical protein C8R45DRAFT_937295 [Mycena sanguinolenta]|nr:hypothetical protein C8R45DRAFT_937295 [Mycena sanguinolenta]
MSAFEDVPSTDCATHGVDNYSIPTQALDDMQHEVDDIIGTAADKAGFRQDGYPAGLQESWVQHGPICSVSQYPAGGRPGTSWPLHVASMTVPAGDHVADHSRCIRGLASVEASILESKTIRFLCVPPPEEEHRFWPILAWHRFLLDSDVAESASESMSESAQNHFGQDV